MSWPLRFIDVEHDDAAVRWEQPEVGLAWHCMADEAAAICVWLPDGSLFYTTMVAKGGGGWTTTGEPPAITVTPSIDTGRWHGFITNGVMTDDVEGRAQSWEPATP